MSRKPLRPGEELSLKPWLWLCVAMLAALLVVCLLPHHHRADVACAMGAHRC